MAIFRRGVELEPGLNIDLKAARQLATIGKGDELLNVGLRLLQQGKAKEGIAALKKAQTVYTEAKPLYASATVSVESWDEICWVGGLWGNPRDFLNACEQAVAMDPKNGMVRDSRGVARARTGDINGAIEDFQLFIDQTDNQEKRSQRQRWVTALRAGKDPFTLEEIEKLRKW